MPGAGAVPPPPPAPTGPGTPSAYQGTPYGTGGYGQPGYGGQAPYGGPGYGYPGAAYPAYPGGAYPGAAYPGAGYGQGWQPGGTYMPNNGTGTAALVLGIVGLVFFFSVVFSIILGVLAIIFGALGRAKASRGEATNGGMALAGLILGSAAVVASVVMIFVYVADENRDSSDSADDSGYANMSVVRVVPPADMSR
ncbi:putative integral membrane protein [Streptomyces himastatinicus ATCC 53653]|uniref:Putative integral membrane protein n=1 Tax=Streptomyces himastatinicus ATCC 53653 TaxID=457427 RepID=D9WBA6_9ACTN|nr:putative integral membrane protein [Streptomyces himastatinicus ATCC 53653]